MDIDSATWKTVGARKKGEHSVSPPTTRNDDTQYHYKEKQIDGRIEGGKGTTTDITPATTTGTEQVQRQNRNSSNHQTTASNSSSTVGKQSALQPDLNIPTNDGTYRLTFRWNPQTDFHKYHENSTLWLTEAYAMMCDLFPDTAASFYRWESKNLQISSVMSDLIPGEFREFLSPSITFLLFTTQIIFGARVCFASKFPSQWRNNEQTIQQMTHHKVHIHLSNSSTNSGKIVTAGYILLKAARTTHRNRFLQSLRKKLPKETPYFDILLHHGTPMEQKINHLVVQCGENHVSPLSKALSELMTGLNSPLYLSRLALANLQPLQFSTYFGMQDLYSKSLKSIPLYPTLINLEKGVLRRWNSLREVY